MTKVVKRTSERYSFGYNQRSTYSYKLTLSPNDIHWQGYMEARPKNIFICGRAIFLLYVESGIETYVELIDKRYFFHYFGHLWWKRIEKSKYERTADTCINLEVPNDE